jgi:hypothetical protein
VWVRVLIGSPATYGDAARARPSSAFRLPRIASGQAAAR